MLSNIHSSHLLPTDLPVTVLIQDGPTQIPVQDALFQPDCSYPNGLALKKRAASAFIKSAIREIRSPKDQAWAFLKIAKAEVAEGSKEKARKTLGEAKKQVLLDRENCFQILLSAAKIEVEIDKNQAQGTLEEAKKYLCPSDFDGLLEAVKIEAEIDFIKAKAVAYSIEDSYVQALALIEMAQFEMENSLETAIRTLEEAKNPVHLLPASIQINLLLRIALMEAKLDRNCAIETLREAKEVDFTCPYSFFEISKAELEIHPENACAILKALKDLVPSLKDMPILLETLSCIIKLEKSAFFDIGETRDMAKKAIFEIQEPFDRIEAALEMLIPVSDADYAREIFQELKIIANEVEYLHRSKALMEIVRAEAKSYPKEAEATALGIEDPYSKVEALLAVVKELVDHDLEHAYETLEQAVHLSSEIKGDELNTAFLSIKRVYQEVLRKNDGILVHKPTFSPCYVLGETVRTTLEEIEAEVLAIKDVYERSSLLIRLVEFELKFDSKETAQLLEILDEAKRAIRQFCFGAQAHSLLEVAELEAKLDSKKVVQTLEEIKEKNIEMDHHRGELLLAIGKIEARVGSDRALETLYKAKESLKQSSYLELVKILVTIDHEAAKKAAGEILDLDLQAQALLEVVRLYQEKMGLCLMAQ